MGTPCHGDRKGWRCGRRHRERNCRLKFFTYRIGWLMLLPAVFALFSGTQPNAAAQTPPDKSTSPSTNKTEPTSPSAVVQQQGDTERERRARAYAKLLEGQRYLSELRR